MLFQLGKGKESFVVPGLPVQGPGRGSRSLLIVSLYDGDNERPGPSCSARARSHPRRWSRAAAGLRRGSEGGGGVWEGGEVE